jgi:formate hydrogenlyase transcriptional activator
MGILGEEKHSLEESVLPAAASQPLFRELFEHSPDGIVVTDSAGHIIEANPHCEELFGFSRQELLGLSIESLIPERYRAAHPQYRQQYLHAPRMRPMGAGLQLYGLHKNASEFPVDILLSPVNAEGLPLTLAVIRDISTRIQTEEALRLSEERFRLLVEGARDYAIFLLDPEGRIATWNPGAERIKGYRAEEIIGQHFSIFYPQEDLERKKPEHELAAALAEGRHEDEGWRVRKDGARFWANVIITPLYNSRQELIGFSKVTRDLTERRRAEDALLLELSTSVLSGLDIQQMMRTIAASVQRVAPNDAASIALYDDSQKLLRPYALIDGQEESRPDIPLVAGQSPEAWVFQTRESLFLANLEACAFPSSSLAQLRAAGIRTGWWLPLNSNGTIIGTLFIGSRQPTAFERLNRNTLLQLAAQIALTIDSVHATRQLAALASRLKEEKRYLEEELRTEYSFEEIVGHSTSLKRVLKQVETVSPTDASVLILGETGTGKELIARAIHNLSPRSSHTFVKVNCSSIPTGLLESELFGHERGAFTGAIAQRIGRLELAHQGTLFLDEIGDLPLELQPKLLRALQEKEIERLGGKRTIPVDFRLLAATHRDLARMVKEGQFRSDLYYRLKVFPILIPLLRQRSEDIPELVNYFVSKHARRMNKRIEVIPEQLMSALARWHWPGNIRELENFLERAVILSSGPELRAPLAELQDLDEVVRPASSTNSTLEAKERDHILQVLRKANGVIGGPGGAAEQLGLKRTTLNSKMKKLGIERRDYR